VRVRVSICTSHPPTPPTTPACPHQIHIFRRRCIARAYSLNEFMLIACTHGVFCVCSGPRSVASEPIVRFRGGQRCPGSIPWPVHRDRAAGSGGDDGGGPRSAVWPEGAPSGRAARVARRQYRQSGDARRRQVELPRLRVRGAEGEAPLASFQWAAATDPLDEHTLAAVARRVWTRRYASTLDPVPSEVTERATSSSAVSRRFVTLSTGASRRSSTGRWASCLWRNP